MHLDATKPLFVIPGAWNPAIFTPPWFAHYVLGRPTGTEIDINVLQKQGDARQIFYIERVGFHAANNRIELYLNDFSAAGFQHIVHVAQKLIELLPYTPINGMGINFFFNESEPSDEVVELLESCDQIKQHFKVVQQTFIAHISYEPKVQLNFKRIPEESSVSFEFNYHHFVTIDDISEKLVNEHLTRLFDDSTATLQKLYGISNYTVLTHQLQA